MIKIYPSIISANLLNVEEEIKKLEAYCDGFHLDVMDFHFVSNLTFGPDFINQISKICSKQLFVHLMVDEPQKWLNVLQLKKNDIFSFHFETKTNHIELINEIHKKNWLTSIAIKPETNIEEIYNLLSIVDQVLVMSVQPGFSGQKFINETYEKIEELFEYKKEKKYNFRIACDGGINKENFEKLIKLGVQDFAIASYIFRSQNPINALEELYAIAAKKF